MPDEKEPIQPSPDQPSLESASVGGVSLSGEMSPGKSNDTGATDAGVGSDGPEPDQGSWLGVQGLAAGNPVQQAEGPKRKRVWVGDLPSTAAISEPALAVAAPASSPAVSPLLVPPSTLDTPPTGEGLAVSAAPRLGVAQYVFAAIRNVDARNLAIIMAGWLLLVVLLPPKHDYPIIDDPVYAESVRGMLYTGTFVRPEWTQASLVGLTVWGAGWSKLFGFSFSTLTASTLALALAGLLAFYGIARLVKVPPGAALLGTGLLAFNPIFLHLSYSFMTDVPLISLMLVACYLYIKGLQARRSVAIVAWMVAGSLVAMWAFYVRQFAVFVPVAFFLYILIEGVLTRKWGWRRIWQLAGVLVPSGVILLLWYLAERNVPPNAGALHAAGLNSRFLFKEPWLRVILLRTLILLPVVGLSAWAALDLGVFKWRLARRSQVEKTGFEIDLRVRVIRLVLVIAAAMAVLWGLYNLALPGEVWTIGMNQGPFSFRVWGLSVDFPPEFYTFGLLGNIIRVDGIDFYQYEQQIVMPPEAWRAIWALGIFLGILLIARIAIAFVDWVASLFRQKLKIEAAPQIACYLTGAAVFIGTVAFTADIFDRYVVGFIPFVILFVVRGALGWKRLAWVYSIAAFLALSTFSFLLQADFVDHNNARWEAGYWLRDHVQPALVGGGWDWNGWVNAGQGSNTYVITDIEYPGLRTERAFPYTSRLGGFTTRYVFAQASPEMPPLPVLPGDSASP